MVTSRLCRTSFGLASAAAVSLFVGCSDDATPSSTPDAATKTDATSSNPDTGAADSATSDGATGAGDSATVSDAGAGADSSQGSDAAGDGGSPDSGSAEDGAADAASDAGTLEDGAAVSADAANDVSTEAAAALDGAGDAPVSSEDAATGVDASTDDGSAVDATADAIGDTEASSDAETDGSPGAGDGASDANDAVAGPLYSYTFDTGNDGWWDYGNYPPTYPDGGVTAPQENSSVTWSSSFGNPAGSLKVDAAFDGSGERIWAATEFYPYPFVDLTGRTISVDIFLAAGSQQYSYLYVFCQDENGNWMDGGMKLFPVSIGGTWFSATLDVSNAAGFVSTGFDRTMIRTVGVEIDSGSGAGPGTITPVTVYLDNIIIQ